MTDFKSIILRSTAALLATGALLILADPAASQNQETFTCTVPKADGSRNLAPRVVGGTDAVAEDWPWQVALQSDSGSLCGGSLIHPQWILTAAHCFKGVHDDVPYDHAGDLYSVWRGGSRIGEGGTRIRGSQRFLHPDYAAKGFGVNDVALLKLESPFVDLQHNAVVQLQKEALERTFALPGACSVVTGWGRVGQDSPPSEVLQKVDVPIVDPEVCRDAHGDVLNEYNVCAGYSFGTKDSCSGDSGGPLVVPGGPTGWTQAGIVSWGRGCANPDAYGVYMRVAPYVPWIQETVAANR